MRYKGIGTKGNRLRDLIKNRIGIIKESATEDVLMTWLNWYAADSSVILVEGYMFIYIKVITT